MYDKPLAIDLFAGLGGWTDGLLAKGWDVVVGFDIERHEYMVPESSKESGALKGTRPREKRGWTQGCAISLGMEGVESKPRTKLLRYPAQLVIQDVLTLHGSQFRDADLIVASPPCQEFSYMAMPWKRAKQIARALRGADEFPDGYKGSRTVAELTALFDACFRIQREACEAAGRHIPMVVENVRGAQPWVGRAAWNYGSFYLWGDVPALMPMAVGGRKNDGSGWLNNGTLASCNRMVPCGFKSNGIKQAGLSGARNNGRGDRWFQDGAASHGSKSSARKAASAMIAKIPLPLSQHIAAVYHPDRR